MAAGLGGRGHLGGAESRSGRLRPPEKPKSYVLEMLPYPSGEPHVGHLKCYSLGDAIAHFRRRNGFEVIHPMGFDSFGLPAENNAIKTGELPLVATERSIESFRKQFADWGSRSTGPGSSRPTPRVLPLDPVDLPAAVRARARLPDPGTGPVVPEGRDGAGQRASGRRPLRALRNPGRDPQPEAVVLQDHRIRPAAARRLRRARGLAAARDHHAEELDRPPEGAEVTFRCESASLDFPVFTTRPDTLFGATFFVMAPEHPELDRLIEGTEVEDQVREYVNSVARESVAERGDEGRPKTGCRSAAR